MIITCAIIDDEPLAAGLLESYAQKTPYLELKGVFNSAIHMNVVINHLNLIF